MKSNVASLAFLTLVLTMTVPGGMAAESLTPQNTAKALEECAVASAPEILDQVFGNFCRTHFGAEKEPLVYERYGHELTVLETGNWSSPGTTSLVIAVETNLPAIGYVEYGGSVQALTKKSVADDRPYYLHVFYLTDLKPDTGYAYRIHLTDERGKVLVMPPVEFRTVAADKLIAIPGDLAGPPYQLTTSGATYVLTTDLVTPDTAIEIIGDDITLDLNGHTVRFAEQAQEKVGPGIKVRGNEQTKVRYFATGVTVRNGFIVQGDGPALAANDSQENFCPLVMTSIDAEVAGVNISYHGPQTWGLTLNKPSGSLNIHHNVFSDRGGIITNRHGAGCRAIGIVNQTKAANSFAMHHNLIRRTRQNGLGGASQTYNNEVYVDSCSTNSFAIQPVSIPGVVSGEYHHNRIFGTGFNAYGFGWAHESLKVHDNLVHFHGIMANSRWQSVESWGDLSTLEAMRVTNYGKGGQVRNDLEYWNNIIVLRGGGGCELRGTGFYSDTTIKDLVFHDNIVKVIADDEATTQVSCISAQGHANKVDALPVIYRNNQLISNVCLVRFGDSYGKGHNHDFLANTFERVGNRADFHALVFGGGYSTWGHDLIDNTVGSGIDLTDVYWQKTGHTSGCSIGWTLHLTAKPGAVVHIDDAQGVEVFNGTVPDTGNLAIPLIQFHIHAPTWEAKTEALDLSGSFLETNTPHQVTVTTNGVARREPVTMDQARTLTW